MSSTKLRFFKTIRFKLTLVYSTILFLFIALFIVLLNVYLSIYLVADPGSRPFQEPPTQYFPNQMTFQMLKEEERERIRQVRSNDLREIQAACLIALLPLSLMSLGLGYWVSGRFLYPLVKLKLDIEQLKSSDLGKPLTTENDDEVGAIVTSFNDLSNRLKEAFLTQELFVQDASHELKTPLTIIQTNLDTILDDPNASQAELRGAIESALGGVKDLRKLTNYLLELTVNKAEYYAKLDLNELVKEQVASLNGFAQSKSLSIKVNLPDSAIFVWADAFSLGRAIYNILENAIKYGAVIEGQTNKVKIELISKGNKAKLSIEDSGPGIPEADQEKIFDRFYQVDKARSRKVGGFGLGLAIAKKVVTDHQGKISLKSEPGKTVFTISLPIQF